MRSKFTRLQRRGAMLFCLAMGTLVLSNCSTQELEFIDPFEFINNDFEGIGDLPAVTDAEISFEEPSTGEVEASAETVAIVADIMGAEDSGDISAETVASLDAVNTFTESQPAAVAEAAESLDAAAVADIMDMDSALPADLSSLQDELSEVSDEIAALLPKIVLSADFDRFRSGNVDPLAPVFTGNKDLMAQSLVGPCADAARAAYEEAMTKMRGQRDTNLATVQANYTRRIGEADARYTTRLALHNEDLAATITLVTATVMELLKAATHAESLGETEIAEQLRFLALFYAVEARTAIVSWNELVLEFLIDVREEEKGIIEERRVLATAQVNASFATAKAGADAILADALGACHNQGSGN